MYTSTMIQDSNIAVTEGVVNEDAIVIHASDLMID